MTNLASVIGAIESNNNPWALRFEPQTYMRIAHPSPLTATIAQLHGCSPDTSRMIASTSWGMFQLMGFNLYDPTVCDVRQPIFRFCDSMALQLQAFHNFTKKRGLEYSLPALVESHEALEKLATAYNGPGNVAAYSMRVLDEIRKQQPELFPVSHM